MTTTEITSTDSFDEHAFEEQIRRLIEHGQFPAVLDLINSMPIEARPRLVPRLGSDVLQQLLEGISSDEAADFLHFLPEVLAVDLLEEITPDARLIFLKNYR